MLDEASFRRESDRALEFLKQALIAAEDDKGSFEFEDNNGVMNIIFENGSSKFVVTPNTPVRQIWISAQATSYKLEWSDTVSAFVLPRTGEALIPLTERLLREHLGDPSITLA
ncbi:MAG TPA: iron donor protein CyaY [Acidobacteriaceae bacterium]